MLIVGGGPEREHNQVAIESNVRYVGKLIPPNYPRTTLFADGDTQHDTVLFEEEDRAESPGAHILRLVLKGYEDNSATVLHYRKPDLQTPLDGASRRADLDRAFDQLGHEGTNAGTPPNYLLYFTGHGSSNRNDLDNNRYDLWNDRGLSVHELAGYIDRLPPSAPVTVVMVQCFSGAFGNLIFQGGDPKGELAGRDIAGFFATIRERVAAGCTPAVNEAEYKDFTSYFFAALTGRDRVGRKVTGADYNRDGRVSMDEAYCYAIANDESIDIPVCTSDVFLRRFATMKDDDVFLTPYRRVRGWASKAQGAALDQLSKRLGLQGDSRLQDAYKQGVLGQADDRSGRGSRDALQHLNALRNDAKRALTARWPDLLRVGTKDFDRARDEAAAELNRHAADGTYDELLRAEKAADQESDSQYHAELRESQLIRLARLGKSIVLEHTLKESGKPELAARLARLQSAERQVLLPPAPRPRQISDR